MGAARYLRRVATGDYPDAQSRRRRGGVGMASALAASIPGQRDHVRRVHQLRGVAISDDRDAQNFPDSHQDDMRKRAWDADRPKSSFQAWLGPG